MEAVEISLPNGFPVGAEWRRDAWLRPISGQEEDFLMQAGGFLKPAARATELLRRCLLRLGPMEPVTGDVVKELSLGDREALLLHLRQITLGDRIACVLSCPACGSTMDLELEVGELLLPAYPNAQALHEAEWVDESKSYIVVFRLPNGADQEEAAAVVTESVENAAEFILQRCIARIKRSDNQAEDGLPGIIRKELPQRMAELDPQAEILFNLTCPECAAGFVVPFDTGDYLYREFARQERAFYRGIHALSLHYHWTEEAILGLSRRKRNLYLDFLADEFGVGRSG
jgi:hypothetical protein